MKRLVYSLLFNNIRINPKGGFVSLLLLILFIFPTDLPAQLFSEESKQRGIDHYFKDKVLTGGGAAFF